MTKKGEPKQLLTRYALTGGAIGLYFGLFFRPGVGRGGGDDGAACVTETAVSDHPASPFRHYLYQSCIGIDLAGRTAHRL